MTNTRWVYCVVLLALWCVRPLWSQTVTSFEGMDASQVSAPEYDVDPNGAVGTKQFMEWTNVNFQAYDKVTFAPVWSVPQRGFSPWSNNGITTCNAINGDGMIVFDRLASRWVIAARTSVTNNYNYCVAVSSTDDLTSASLTWYTYVFSLNSILGKNAQGTVYFPDWPKIGTWADAYYVAMDLNDPNLSYREVGFVACALDRSNMLVNGTARAPICFREPNPVSTSVYLGHSLIPADVEGTAAPPTGRDEFFTSIQNPVLDGTSNTSTTINLWDFHVDWSTRSNSAFTQTSLVEAAYQPGCYTAGSPANTVCVPEPTSISTNVKIDSVGDRFMPRMSYRNFGSYESFVVSHTVQVGTGNFGQTGIRWYELRDSGSGTPFIYQNGNVSPDQSQYRFMPSIAEDTSGNAALGYMVSSAATHPSMSASYFSLTSPTPPKEIELLTGTGDEENTYHWGDYSSMTVDPVDGCTFWYVNQYFPNNQTATQINWGTRIANFRLANCGEAGLSPGSLSFGSQVTGSTSAAQKIVLTNNQSVALNISSISFTGTNPGDFAQTNTCGGTVNAGGNCTISVTFTPGATGLRLATLNVNDDGSNSPQTALLSGTGVAPVTLSTASIKFGGVLIGNSATSAAVTLHNNQNVALTNIVISIVGSTEYTQTNTCGTGIPALSQCSIKVTFAPTVSGTQTATVNIADSASNSPQTISLTGTGNLPVSFSPISLNFGTQTVGTTSAAKTITVTNHQKVALSISSIAPGGNHPGDYNISGNTCGSSLAAGAQCVVSITFTPTAKGTRNANLVLTDSAATSPQTANLTGTGG
jgi:hypothetical protein